MLNKLGIPAESLLALDRDQQLLMAASSRCPGITTICHDLTDYPYPKVLGKANLVTAHQVFQYLTTGQLHNCLAELFHILPTEGFLVIGVPHPIRVAMQSSQSYFSQKAHDIPAPWGGHTRSWTLSVSGYVNLIISVGFKILMMKEPEITRAGAGKPGASAYSTGPTRLMILAQVP